MSRPLLFFPSEGSSDWELWTLRSATAPPERTGATADPAQSAAAARALSKAVMALPVGQCLALPLWLNATNATNATNGALFGQMIVAQLEKRGLAPRHAGPPVFDFAVVAEAEGRMLVRVMLLAGNFPEALCFPKVCAYVASVDLLPLPEGHLVLWQEGRNLAVAAVRGGRAVYTQLLARSPQITHETARELRAIRFALEAEQAVVSVEGVTLWGEFPEGSACLEALELPVHQAARPAPSAPAAWEAMARPGLVPEPLRRARMRTAKRKRSLRLAAVAALGYLALVVLLGSHLRSLRGEAGALVESVQRDKPAAAELERAAAAWRVVESAVDPAYFALEQFHLCVEAMPPVGIRFTQFEIKGPAIQIRGNARNAPELFKYVDALKGARTISRYGWRAGQPRVFQDNTVEFKIEGNIR